MSEHVTSRETRRPAVGAASGFKLEASAGGGQQNIEIALARNRSFAAAGATRAPSCSPTCACS